MNADQKLQRLEQKRREAQALAMKAERAVLKFHVRRHLTTDSEYRQVMQQLKELKGALHRARLSITKKTEGLRLRREAIKRMESQLEEHRREEHRVVQQLREINHKRTAIESQAKKRVVSEKKLSEDLLRDHSDQLDINA